MYRFRATGPTPHTTPAEPATETGNGNELVESPIAAESGQELPAAAEPALEEAETAVNPIVARFPDAPQISGDILIVYGQVLDTNGAPLPGTAVEFWQTDRNGRYDHPGDPTSSLRDMSFQFYGTSTADEAGIYTFRTAIPGTYENRPRHIHVKVKMGDEDLLTTQLYFATDLATVEGETVFSQAGEQGAALLMETKSVAAVGGGKVTIAEKDLVVNAGTGSGSLPLTPAQAAGPYYPVVDVSAFDNDFTILP